MKKRRHHHVWKGYLRAWATKDRLAVLQAGEVRTAHVDDVAVQRDFYALQLLTDDDIKYIRKFWIEPSHKRFHDMHERMLALFAFAPRVRARLTEAQIAADPELVELLDEQILNGEEDYHANVESAAAPLIERARNGDISFFNDPGMAVQLSHFLALQHFRTATMRTRTIRRLQERMGIDITRCWNVMSHIFATNVGCSIFVDRKLSPLRLLENKTALTFITSDQPTVNIAGGLDMERAPEHFSFYYPISPRHALLLDDAEQPCGLTDRPLTIDDVQMLNIHELRLHGRQVFGASKDALAPYVAVAA